MTPESASGIETITGRRSVDETVSRLLEILQERGIKLFAVIDHSGEAERAGLQMPPTKLVVFGNPKAGTPVMLAAPSIAIDLPLKILIAADDSGTTRISFTAASHLGARHGVPRELIGNLGAAEALARLVAE